MVQTRPRGAGLARGSDAAGGRAWGRVLLFSVAAVSVRLDAGTLLPASSTDGSGVGLLLQSVGRRDICSVGGRSGPGPGGAQDEGQDQHFDSDGEAVEEGPVQ